MEIWRYGDMEIWRYGDIQKYIYKTICTNIYSAYRIMSESVNTPAIDRPKIALNRVFKPRSILT